VKSLQFMRAREAVSLESKLNNSAFCTTIWWDTCRHSVIPPLRHGPQIVEMASLNFLSDVPSFRHFFPPMVGMAVCFFLKKFFKISRLSDYSFNNLLKPLFLFFKGTTTSQTNFNNLLSKSSDISNIKIQVLM